MAAPRVPLVFTPHGFAFAGFFSSRSERFAYRAIERGLAPLASRVICVCEAEARLARSVGAKGRVRVVHNGIDPPQDVEPDPELEALRSSGPVLGVLSGLRPGKGLETAIAALAEIREDFPGASLVVAGEGPERAALEALADELGVADAVQLPGLQPDPYRFLVCADLFVFPSLAESFPYSILEAMAMARPIVASDVGGVGEAIEDGRSGLLVPPGDPHALAAAVGGLLGDSARAGALGDAARLRQSERFTLSGMVDRTLAVYGELD